MPCEGGNPSGHRPTQWHRVEGDMEKPGHPVWARECNALELRRPDGKCIWKQTTDHDPMDPLHPDRVAGYAYIVD